MKTFYLQGGQDANCHMIDAQDEEGTYCLTAEAKAEITKLKAKIESMYEDAAGALI